MLSQEELEKILKISLSGGGDFADIFIEEVASTSITCEDNKLEKITSGTDTGVGIRVLAGNETFYGCSPNRSFRYLSETARKVASEIGGTAKDIKFELKPSLSPLRFEIKRKPNDVSIEEKVDIVATANKVARSYGDKVKQVIARYVDSNQAVSIANSEGRYIEDNRIRTRFAIQVIAAKEGVLQTGYEAPGGTVGFELFEEHDPERTTRMAAERALLMLDAKHAPAGQMPVVLSSEAGGTMIHEACGHALEADFIHKGTSIFAGKVGEKVASEIITVIDDTTLAGKFGSYRFDDEGTPGQRKVLIENGILKGFMSDRYTGKQLGIPSSGNGRRQSYRTKPVPRMTNTLIESGMTNPTEIIASVKNGLLVKRMGGGQVNIVNGDFVFEITEGYLIEDGKIKNPVRGAILMGNGPEVLRTIDMVGWDLGFQTGVCGKYDHAPVSDAQPTIRIPKIVVGGRH
ncbi:TldD/PmbA family protein [Candidatus Margulisiibacteriota bacterium]